MGCSFILLGLGLVGLIITLVFWIVFPNELGTYMFLLTFGPISLLFIIISTVIIAKSHKTQDLMKDALRDILYVSSKEKITYEKLRNLTELKAEFRSIVDINILNIALT